MNTSRASTAVLRDMLTRCEDSFNHIYTALDTDADEREMTFDLPESLAQLLREIRGAQAVALVFSDTSQGWPADPGRAMLNTGPRSGHPADLVNGLFSMAEAMTAVTYYAVVSSAKDQQSPCESLNGALWGVHNYLLQVEAILTCDPAVSDSKPMAA